MITSTGEKVKMNAGSLNDFNRMKQAETGVNPKLTYSKLRNEIITNSDPSLVNAVNADQFATAEHSFEKLSDITGMTGMTSREDRSIDSGMKKGAEPRIDGKGLVKSKKYPKLKYQRLR